MAIRPDNNQNPAATANQLQRGLTELRQDSRSNSQNPNAGSRAEENLDRLRSNVLSNQRADDNRAATNRQDASFDRTGQSASQIASQDRSNTAENQAEVNNRQQLGTRQTLVNPGTSSEATSGTSSLGVDQTTQLSQNLNTRLSSLELDDRGLGLTPTNELLQNFVSLRDTLSQNSEGAIQRAYQGSGSLVSILV